MQAMDDARQVVRVAAVVSATQPLHVIVADGGAAAPRQAQKLLRKTQKIEISPETLNILFPWRDVSPQ